MFQDFRQKSEKLRLLEQQVFGFGMEKRKREHARTSLGSYVTWEQHTRASRKLL